MHCAVMLSLFLSLFLVSVIITVAFKKYKFPRFRLVNAGLLGDWRIVLIPFSIGDLCLIIERRSNSKIIPMVLAKLELLVRGV